MGVLENGDEDVIREAVQSVLAERSKEFRPNRSLLVSVASLVFVILGAASVNLIVVTRGWTLFEAEDVALNRRIEERTADRWTATQALHANALLDQRIDSNMKIIGKLEGRLENMQGQLQQLIVQTARMAHELERRNLSTR